MHCIFPRSRAQALIRSLNTTPGTFGDDIGCALALLSLSAVAYVLLVLA